MRASYGCGGATPSSFGYEIERESRRRGYAIETVQALMRWARDEHDTRVFIASIASENEPSLAIVRKLGLGQVGEHWTRRTAASSY